MQTARTTVLLGLLVPGSAAAFCGTYVGGAGASITNSDSRIILAREGTRTTLTIANDVEGDFDDFALVVPIPEVIREDRVRTTDPEIFDRVEAYSGPRMVAYTCEDVAEQQRVSWDPPSLGCTEFAIMAADGAETDWDADTGGVTVEASFDEAEYDIVILSATGGDGLQSWLDANGYAIPEGGEAILQEYIDAGSYFLAAKIDREELGDRDWLSPLMFSYQSDVFSLPIKIGTISSAGVQDLTVYVVTDLESGEVHIANYDQVAIEDECLLRLEDDDFGAAWSGMLDEALGGSDRAAWLVEYSWKQDPQLPKCDPCTEDPLTGLPALLDLWELGYGLDWSNLEDTGTPSTDTGWGAVTVSRGHFTRLHMRYTPEQVDQDLVFYATNTGDNSQIRFIQHLEEMESLFPVCGEGWVEDPGRCPAAVEVEQASVLPRLALTGLGALVLAVFRRRRG